MPRVVFMCGPAGSGKSTAARELEAGGLVRLSFDDAAWARGLRTMPLSKQAHAEIEQDLQRRLVGLVQDGHDVVLDLSFWSREMRERYRRLLAPLGVTPETTYLQTPREVALARVRARRAAHGDDYRLADHVAAAYFDQFEPPTADEGPLRVVRCEDGESSPPPGQAQSSRTAR